jgi:hypothetical protein
MKMAGSVGILNVGAGDTKLTFDPKKPDEVKKSAKIVADMIKRGFVLLIEVGKGEDGEPIYRRAKAFDEKTCEYIIAGTIADPTTTEQINDEKQTGTPPRKGKAAQPAKRDRRGNTRIAASSTSAVAVSRTAGG